MHSRIVHSIFNIEFYIRKFTIYITLNFETNHPPDWNLISFWKRGDGRLFLVRDKIYTDSSLNDKFHCSRGETVHKKPRKILTGIISAIDTLFLILERQRERQTDRQTEKERERERESRSRNLSRNLSLDREWSVKPIITFPSNYRPFNRKSTIRVDSAKIWPPLPDFLDIHIRSSFGTDRANRSRSSFAQIALINRITNSPSSSFLLILSFFFDRSGIR